MENPKKTNGKKRGTLWGASSKIHLRDFHYLDGEAVQMSVKPVPSQDEIMGI